LRTIPPQRPSEAGFTLIELMLVVVILAVLASVAIPRYSRSFGFMKLRSGAYDVAATVEYARAMSVLEDRTLRVEFTVGSGHCVISEEDAPANRKAFATLTHELPDGVRIDAIGFADTASGGRDYIEFRPDGDCEPCTIRVTGHGGETFSIEITRGAGHARVKMEAEGA
jgi:prepilin-type N-terminal cleavage/methylation domain-containing protein